MIFLILFMLSGCASCPQVSTLPTNYDTSKCQTTQVCGGETLYADCEGL